MGFETGFLSDVLLCNSEVYMDAYKRNDVPKSSFCSAGGIQDAGFILNNEDISNNHGNMFNIFLPSSVCVCGSPDDDDPKPQRDARQPQQTAKEHKKQLTVFV